MENILHRFIKGPTHFGMPRGAEVNLFSMNRNMLLFIQISALPLSVHHKWKETIHIVCKTTYGDQLPTKSPVELKSNSKVICEIHKDYRNEVN
jgi:hypothetical protein